MMRALVIALLAFGCTEPYDGRLTEKYWELGPGETTPACGVPGTPWKKIETSGDTPGHGDTIRHIYANPCAQTLGTSDSKYVEGAIIVKEVYANNGGQPGSLGVIELMRRIGPQPMSHENELGWVFSAASVRGGEEAEKTDFCWYRCHVNAPIAGAWFDYSK